MLSLILNATIKKYNHMLSITVSIIKQIFLNIETDSVKVKKLQIFSSNKKL